MSTNEHNELQKRLESVTPEQLRNISAGQLFATGAAVRHLVELLRKDKTAEPLQDGNDQFQSVHVENLQNSVMRKCMKNHFTKIYNIIESHGFQEVFQKTDAISTKKRQQKNSNKMEQMFAFCEGVCYNFSRNTNVMK